MTSSKRKAPFRKTKRKQGAAPSSGSKTVTSGKPAGRTVTFAATPTIIPKVRFAASPTVIPDRPVLVGKTATPTPTPLTQPAVSTTVPKTPAPTPTPLTQPAAAVDPTTAGKTPTPTPTPLTRPAAAVDPTTAGKTPTPTPTPLAQPAVPLKFVKTRRQSVTLTRPLPSDVRHAYSASADQEALRGIYAEFYGGDGNRKAALSADAIAKRIYRRVGIDENSRYLSQPITTDRLTQFLDMNEQVEAQQSDDPYVAAENGDYFHVTNSDYDREREKRGRVRRIVVNVTNQEAGLEIAGALTGLFYNRTVYRNLEKYKILLSTTRMAGAKYDKLVVYYVTEPGDADAPDTIGNTIAATIQSAVDGDDVEDSFAPFYSHIGHGMAWAEDPDNPEVSFTQVRSDIVAQVIADNPKLSSKEFAEKVQQNFQTQGVPSDAPHRHLVPSG